MTDMELAYRKAEIDKEMKKQKGFYYWGMRTNCNNYAYALEIALIQDLCSTPGMTREVAYQIVQR